MATSYKPQQRRGIQFERVFRLAEQLRRLRFGATLQQLTAGIREATEHPWHQRTIGRDLDLLVSIGVVDFRRGRYEWKGEEFFAVPAEAIALAADTKSALSS